MIVGDTAVTMSGSGNPLLLHWFLLVFALVLFGFLGVPFLIRWHGQERARREAFGVATTPRKRAGDVGALVIAGVFLVAVLYVALWVFVLITT